MDETPKLLAPSWDEVHSLLIELSRNIKANYRPQAVIAALRGGLIPARIVADLLDIPTIGTVGVAFYQDIGQRMRRPAITQPVSIPVEGTRILLVDDIVDTGETLALLTDELRRRAGEMRTATVYRKPSTRFSPDYSTRETDAWVVFPWELRETVDKVGRRLLGSGKTPEEVAEYLAEAGIDQRLAERLLRDFCRGAH